jgi:hypothetical protein
VSADVGAVLAGVVKHDGAVPGVQAAAKTGSQQWANTLDSSDAWTAGWAPGLAAVTWVGREHPGPIRDKNGKAVNGEGMPYRIWRDFLAGALRGQPGRPMPAPAMVGRRGGEDLRTFDANAKRAYGRVYPGPQKGEKVDKSKAKGSWPERVARLTEQLNRYAGTVPDFAVSVVDRKTGHRYDYHGDRPYQSASVIKVELLAALLLRAQDAHRKLSSPEVARATKMIRASDNTAASQIYHAVGGVDGLRAAGHRLGLNHTMPARSFGESTTTATDQTRMIGALAGSGNPLDKGSRNFILQLMSSVNADQAWGVSAAAFAGEQTSLKNGWLASPREGNRWVVNSTGRISSDKVDVVVSVLSHGHNSKSGGIEVVENVAALTRSYLGW